MRGRERRRCMESLLNGMRIRNKNKISANCLSGNWSTQRKIIPGKTKQLDLTLEKMTPKGFILLIPGANVIKLFSL
jgi:hypothetical protein